MSSSQFSLHVYRAAGPLCREAPLHPSADPAVRLEPALQVKARGAGQGGSHGSTVSA